METIRRYALCVAIGLILGGAAVEYGPMALRLLPGSDWGTPVDAMIVYESGFDTVPTREFTKMITHAPRDCGVRVIDKDTLGKGKQPSAELQPYLDAAKGHDLPVLVSHWASGLYSAKPCPETLEGLKAEVGK